MPAVAPFIDELPGPYLMIVEFLFGFVLLFIGVLMWKVKSDDGIDEVNKEGCQK